MNIIKTLCIFIIFEASSHTLSYSQTLVFDTLSVRKDMIALSGKKFCGRGYVQNGDLKASEYIRKKFDRFGLSYFSDQPYQYFKFNVNTFPSALKLTVNGNKLLPGKDYLIHPSSPSYNGNAVLSASDNKVDNSFGVAKLKGVSAKDRKAFIDSLAGLNGLYDGIIITDEKKLTWWVSDKQNEVPVILVRDSVIFEEQGGCKLHVKSKLKEHEARNVIAYVPGVVKSSKKIVITAHYDHLGKMGKHCMFPGANDNASGTSLLMELARFYMLPENRTNTTIVFMAFAGEEAGLLGSKFFVENPLFPLNEINFLINLDLLGTGEDGMMVVNGEVHKEQFELLDSLNTSGGYFGKLSKRGKAANSDHYPFSEAGVPSFFFYTMGPRTAYHDINDTNETLDFPKMIESLKLITDFIKILDNRSDVN